MSTSFCENYAEGFCSLPPPSRNGSPKILVLVLGPQSNVNIVMTKEVKLIKMMAIVLLTV